MEYPKNGDYMKKGLLSLVLFLTIVLTSACGCGNKLPKPEIDQSAQGQQFGLDKNINIETVDKYLFRDDVVYRDMRMLVDPATYGNIGGDSYLSGFVEGFEVVPFPYISTMELPEIVTNAYDGPTLFSVNSEGKYVANYEESMDILEYLFPKDKVIFLMCGGGGYAGATRSMLISLGWDKDKLYNVGGHWYYKGDHNVEVKREENGKTYYDFYKVNYHIINDFDSYTEVSK